MIPEEIASRTIEACVQALFAESVRLDKAGQFMAAIAAQRDAAFLRDNRTGIVASVTMGEDHD